MMTKTIFNQLIGRRYKHSAEVLSLMHPEFKLWIENEKGEQIIGEGLLQLLEEIRKTGSLNKASSRLNMSYRTAWGKIEKVEERLGWEIVSRRAGGEGVGGSELTGRGEDLMKKYNAMKKKARDSIEKDFFEVFGDYLE